MTRSVSVGGGQPKPSRQRTAPRTVAALAGLAMLVATGPLAELLERYGMLIDGKNVKARRNEQGKVRDEIKNLEKRAQVVREHSRDMEKEVGDLLSKDFPTGNAAATTSYVMDPVSNSPIPLHVLWDSNVLRVPTLEEVDRSAAAFMRKYPRSTFPELKSAPAGDPNSFGKDRTGWAAAAFLSLMGVPKKQVYEDYLRSNDYILPAYQKAIDAFVAAGGDAEIPEAILGVKSEYLDATFDEMQKRYGTIQGYLSEGLGIDAAKQQALRDLYLDRDQALTSGGPA